jgi:AcrR family transcriptional regulator
MYHAQVPPSASPTVRRALVERAAEMLARREPVTLRALVAGTGASTMAVYTYFDGMPGLWRAVRQEGFTRLAAALSLVERTEDPVQDLAACGRAYLANALAHPDLYRLMFDTQAELEDAAAADASFTVLVEAAARARSSGRLDVDVGPADVATRLWVFGHGLASLVISGALPRTIVEHQAVAGTVALLTVAGDERARCHRSVTAAWTSPA